MLKRIAAGIFIMFFWVSLFFPLKALAGSYQINYCQWDDKNGNGRFDHGEKLLCESAKSPTGAFYEGLVPCGKEEICVAEIGQPLDEGKIKDALDQGKGFKEACSEGGGHFPTDENEPLIYCQFCHFFVLIDGIIDFVLVYIVPVVGVLMLVVGGVFFYFGGTSPNFLTQGKTLIKGVVIGLFLIYGAYLLVGTTLTILGAATVEPIKGVFSNGVFSFKCSVEVPCPTPNCAP